MPLVAAIQLPAALAYIFDGIFLGARDFRFLGIAMVRIADCNRGATEV